MIGMGCSLDHRAHIVWDNDTPARTKPFNGFTHRQRIVHPRPAISWSTLCLTVFRNSRVPWAGLQHDRGGAGAAPMSVQPPKPLQQYIGRHYVCHEKVRIDIKALLASLRADDH